MKICKKCKKLKSLDDFHKNKSKRSGYSCNCKLCHKSYLQTKKEYLSKKRKEYYLKNRDKALLVSKKWNRENKQRRNLRKRLKWKNDIQYKLKQTLRNRLWLALTKAKGAKSVSTLNLLGCTIEFLKSYLELHFLGGMTWDNHCIDGWNIDHIIPCAAFDLTKEEEQRKCFHYSNLMPRWATTEIAMSYGSNQIGNFNKGDNLCESQTTPTLSPSQATQP